MNRLSTYISVVCKVYVAVLEEVVVDLVPRVFDESDGYVAKGRRELGSNPSPSDLLVSVVACPENASVECIGNDGGDVGGLDGALCGVFLVMPADVGMVEWVAGCLDIDGEGVCGLLCLPVLNHGVDRVDEAVLGNRVEETDEVIVGGIQGDVRWGLGEVAVEMAPKLRNGKLAWMLWIGVLGNDVRGTASDA